MNRVAIISRQYVIANLPDSPVALREAGRPTQGMDQQE